MKNKILYSILLFVWSGVCGILQAQVQLTNLPSVYINTENGQAVNSKNVYVAGTLTYVDKDSIAVYDMSIRGRGNSTWGLAKKPYRIKFDESTKFLGKGYAKSKSWVLLANHADKALIRNAVTFEMGEFMEIPFNPAVRFVDLTLNGNFMGSYHLTDQIKVDGHRVEVKEQDYPLTDTSNISGGYLVEVDGFGASEPVNFRTQKNIIISVKYPEDDQIEKSQINYIQDYIQQFETALFSTDYADPVKGYRAYVDSATLVNWYLASELSANVDCFWSTNLYKEQDDPKLYFGPLWDYDIGYNNCNRVGDVTNRTMMDAGFGTSLSKIWVNQMIKDNWFNKAVNDRWKVLLSRGIERHLLNYIDSMAIVIDRSQTLNYQKWSISSRVYNEIYLYSTYQEYIDQLKRFITQHIVYLTTTFAARVKDEPGPKPEPKDSTFQTDGSYYYLVLNRGCGNALDVKDRLNEEGALIELYASTVERFSQHWQLVPAGDCFLFLNRETGLAMNDPTETPLQVGTRLNLAKPDVTDTHQLWKIVLANDGYYNIINSFSNNVINNSGGGSANGNPVVSYTNDSRNTVSNNRQWNIEAQEKVPEPDPVDTVRGMLPATAAKGEIAWEPDLPGNDDAPIIDGLLQLPSFDYRVAYNDEKRTLRFVTDDMENLKGINVALYDAFGRLAMWFAADRETSVANLPAGVYLLRWKAEGKDKSVKFLIK